MKHLPMTLKLVESVFAIEQDGTRPETVRRSWKERLFTRPWRPWVSTKTIQVPNYKPAIFRAGNVVYYHPSMKNVLMKPRNHE